MLALAWVLINEALYDVKFIARYTVGFERFAAYVTGDNIRNNIDRNTIGKVADWFSSDLGQKIVYAETNAINEMTVIDIDSSTNHQINDKRLAIYKNLIESTNSYERSYKAAYFTYRIDWALSEKTNLGVLPEDYQNYKTQNEDLINKQVEATYNFAYKSLSDQELGEYVKFYNYSYGQKYASAISQMKLSLVTYYLEKMCDLFLRTKKKKLCARETKSLSKEL